MDKSADVFETRHFSFCRKLLLFTGLWPFQNKKKTTIIMRIWMCIILMSFTNAAICKIITSRNNMRIVIEVIPPLLSCIGIAIKYLNSWMNMTKMKKFIEKIRHDWQCAVLNKEEHIFEYHAEEVWKINVIYSNTLNFFLVLVIIVVMMFIYFTSLIVSTIQSKLTSANITRFTHPPLQVELFIDEKKYFPYILIFINTCLIHALLLLLAVDSGLNIVINHALTMFAVVGNRLENAFRFNLGEHDKNAEVNEILIRTVQYHREAIKFVENINSYCSVSYLLLCGICIVIMSVLLVHVCIVLKGSESYDIVMIPLLNIIGHVIVLYFNCFFAQKMIDTSSYVFHQSYCGKWYNSPISTQKLLLMIMQRCLNPASIIFANVFTVTKEKMAAVIESSLSYFTVLYSLQ